ncbi:MAG: hypothetical protein V4543_13010 [Bacteroidota bacterium]
MVAFEDYLDSLSDLVKKEEVLVFVENNNDVNFWNQAFRENIKYKNFKFTIGPASRLEHGSSALKSIPATKHALRCRDQDFTVFNNLRRDYNKHDNFTITTVAYSRDNLTAFIREEDSLIFEIFLTYKVRFNSVLKSILACLEGLLPVSAYHVLKKVSGCSNADIKTALSIRDFRIIETNGSANLDEYKAAVSSFLENYTPSGKMPELVQTYRTKFGLSAEEAAFYGLNGHFILEEIVVPLFAQFLIAWLNNEIEAINAQPGTKARKEQIIKETKNRIFKQHIVAMLPKEPNEWPGNKMLLSWVHDRFVSRNIDFNSGMAVYVKNQINNWYSLF